MFRQQTLIAVTIFYVVDVNNTQVWWKANQVLDHSVCIFPVCRVSNTGQYTTCLVYLAWWFNI